MFIQVIQGTVADADHLQRQVAQWRSQLKPGATGYLGATGGVTSDGRGVTLVRFDSEEAARANGERPEQSDWWAETSKAYGGDVQFHDCHEVDEGLGGGSDDAGFVQVIQGRAKDQEAMRRRLPELQAALKERRPDILGMVIAWHGDGGGFTQAVYFTSADAARQGESNTEGDELRTEYQGFFAEPPTFHDLDKPDLD